MKTMNNIIVKAWCLINANTGSLKLSEVIEYGKAAKEKESIDKFIGQFETW
jgi:hypothetical protein